MLFRSNVDDWKQHTNITGEEQAKKAKGDAVKCHRQADIEVGGNARRCRVGARG